MRSVLGVFVCVLATGLVACGDIQEDGITVVFDDEATGAVSHTLTEGSADAVGLLNFLNDEETTFEVLDIDARLDKRSAAGLIHHRNGPDGIHGTWDDDRFDSVDEVDAVKWVGSKTINRILRFAGDLGFVPFADDLLGIYDGVEFTVNEADAVLDMANFLNYEALDALLNRRAVSNIIAARPIASLEDLARVRYVGGKALSTLKEQVAKTQDLVQQN
tara:strand:- start:1271 stop:1924 length:654 start_codon:yes stop_codon:yes gene_type:complete